MKQYDNKGRAIIREGDQDPRYTIRIFLIRNGRPKYWNFHCIFCGRKLCELNGTVVMMSDVSNEGLHYEEKSAQRIRCNTHECGGRNWYELNF